MNAPTTLETAHALARRAGGVLATYRGRLSRGDARRKSARRDLVSEADVESERAIREGLPAGDDVLGEEGSARDTGARRLWIVDPLDGTVNFLHGIPFWCVSIAAVEDGALAAAVVHAPELGLTWAAARGGGCTLNGEPAAVTTTADLAEAVVATGFAYRRNELPDTNFDNFEAIGMAAAGIRRMGSAAIDLAFLACGRLDAFWELHLEAWDVAAGALLVREAGGRVTDFAGREALDDVLRRRHVVASNGKLHQAIRARLAPLRGLA